MPIKFNPQFIVIGGPNGAGKSTTSKELLQQHNILAFDWDQRFHEKWNRFGFDPTIMEGVCEATNEEFNNHVLDAFSAKSSLAYETNFHSDFNFRLAKEAKSKGYQTVLYFLAMDKVETCIERVHERVLKGGHDVSRETIEYRFNAGFNMLNQAITHYDKIYIHDSSDSFRPLIVIEGGTLLYQSENLNNTILDKLHEIKSMLT